MYFIFDIRETESEHALLEITEDTILEALFKEPVETLLEQRVCSKSYYSSHNAETDDDDRAKKESGRKLKRLEGC